MVFWISMEKYQGVAFFISLESELTRKLENSLRTWRSDWEFGGLGWNCKETGFFQLSQERKNLCWGVHIHNRNLNSSPESILNFSADDLSHYFPKNLGLATGHSAGTDGRWSVVSYRSLSKCPSEFRRYLPPLLLKLSESFLVGYYSPLGGPWHYSGHLSFSFHLPFLVGQLRANIMSQI